MFSYRVYTYLCLGFCLSCNYKSNNDKNAASEEYSINELDTAIKESVSFICDSVTEDGPPFITPCLCDFKELAEIRLNDSVHLTLISGKNWDPCVAECTWIWGEDENNRPFPDSSVVEHIVYLVDLETCPNIKTQDILESEELRKNTMIVSVKRRGYPFKTKFDPYKTNKWPRPYGW